MTHQRQPDDNADASDGLIRFSCHHCGKRLKADSKHAGKPAKCSCGSRPLVPFHDVPVFEPASEPVQLPWIPPVLPKQRPTTTGEIIASSILLLVAGWSLTWLSLYCWLIYSEVRKSNVHPDFYRIMNQGRGPRDVILDAILIWAAVWFFPALIGVLVAFMVRKK